MVKERTNDSYTKIKHEVLEAYYAICRDEACRLERTHYEVMGSLTCCFEYYFERPVSHFLYCTTILIVSGNWYKSPMRIMRSEIEEAIKEGTLREVELLLKSSEYESLKSDLRKLRFDV